MCTWINVMHSFCYIVRNLLFYSHVYCYFVMIFCQFVMLLVVIPDKNSSFFNVGKPLPDMVLTFIFMRFTFIINFITYWCSRLTPYSYIVYVYVSLWFWFVIFHDYFDQGKHFTVLKKIKFYFYICCYIWGWIHCNDVNIFTWINWSVLFSF